MERTLLEATQVRAESFALLDKYFELGGNTVDTARVYGCHYGSGDGISEQTVGKARQPEMPRQGRYFHKMRASAARRYDNGPPVASGN